MWRKRVKGFMLLEALLGLTIATAILFSLLTLGQLHQRKAKEREHELDAYLQAWEAVRMEGIEIRKNEDHKGKAQANDIKIIWTEGEKVIRCEQMDYQTQGF